jgi:hypothetical protein
VVLILLAISLPLLIQPGLRSDRPDPAEVSRGNSVAAEPVLK